MKTRRKVVCHTKARMLVGNRFRLLWEQHVYWTRMTVLAIAFDSPDLAATVGRLLRNALDFAKALDRYYRKAQAMEFGRLLKEHLVIAADLVKALKAGDSGTAKELETKWYANADALAVQMNRMNPFWTLTTTKAMWHRHLDLLKEEVGAILGGDFEGSVTIFDIVEKQALMMAGVFSTGIIKQFGLR